MSFRKISPFFLQNLIWIPTRAILRFFCRFHIEGGEHLREIRSGVIFASNHVSELDPILLPAGMPFLSRFLPMFYVSRKSYLDSIRGIRKYLYGGRFFKAWGAYPTHSGKHSYETSLQEHADILRHGGNLCIFPEGEISPDGKTREVHGGAAYLSSALHVPIVPVSIEGAFGITPKKFFTRQHSITLRFCAPRIVPQTAAPTPDYFRSKTKEIMLTCLVE